MSSTFREILVGLARNWQDPIGVTPGVSLAVARYDAAVLSGLPEPACRGVSSGADFVHQDLRYQVIASREPELARVPRVPRDGWDRLVWLVYDRDYALLEAWSWDAESYRRATAATPATPEDLRRGQDLLYDISA